MISYLHSLLNPVRNIIPGTLLHACIIIILMLITTSFISSAACAPDIYVNQTGWYRSGGEFNISSTPIQAAVNSATAGNMIYVYSGTYKENVNVDRRLTLQGEGADVVNVTAGLTSDHVFEVTADYVNISGFSLSGANNSDYYYNCKAGIYLDSADHCNIFNNNVLKNGIGISLRFSKNNMLMNNTAKSNYQSGISLQSSSNNMLTNNTANSNKNDGIYLPFSSDNTLTNNTAKSNDRNGIRLYYSSNNTLTNNTAKSNDGDGIRLYYSSNNTLTNNTAKSNDGDGIYLYYSSNYNTLTNNTANSNDGDGIYLYYSSNNTLTNNTAKSNQYGIYLISSIDNFIYNNYFNNTINAYDSGNNIWNTTPAPGTNIIGGPYLGGNYWSDYDGKDTDGDGLGDTLLPYNIHITNGGDYHPLVQSVPSPDTTPPVITNISNSTPARDSITIIWDTDENSNSLVKYGTVQSNYTDAVLDTVMVSTHKITLSGLMPDTVYYFAVNSTDASNNSAQSEELKFNTAAASVPSFTTVSIENVTLAPGESTRVPIMINNVDNLGGCSINLTCDASVVHVTGVLQGDMNYLTYNLDNGTGWMTANALNNPGLNGDIVFANIELNAVGIIGDETLLNITVVQLIATGFNPIDHTVKDGIFIIEADTEAPLVADTSTSPDTILNDNGRSRAPGTNITTLSVMVTDAGSGGAANVTIDLSSIGGSADEPMVREGDTDIWTVTVNASAGINLTHQLTINATDNKGNFNDSVSITLTVLRRGDVYRDNVIDSNDVIYIARYLAGLEPECSNPPGVLVGDVVDLSGDAKGDSTVDLMDALYLARYTAGLEEEP